MGSITDVPGVRVGHAQRADGGWLSGVTVVLPPPGTVGSVDVRGGGPATRETDALAPSTLVPTLDAVCLSGGSAYGLAAADGVMRWCEEEGFGFPVLGPPPERRALVVPIVPAASIFDLGRGGDPSARPDAAMGYLAADAAAAAPTSPSRGAVGAGTGALTAAGALSGGVGQASLQVTAPSGVTVTLGALAVVNALGSPVDPEDGGLLGRALLPPGAPRPPAPPADQADAVRARISAALATSRAAPRSNTTLAVVATDAALDPAATWRAAAAGHDGLARALRPAHTMLDGDTVFALATGAVRLEPLDLVAVQVAAADAVLAAVVDAVLAAPRRATPAIDVPGYLDVCPGARPT